MFGVSLDADVLWLSEYARTVEKKTGIPIRVSVGPDGEDRMVMLTVGGTGVGSMPLRSAGSLLTGVLLGVQEARA